MKSSTLAHSAWGPLLWMGALETGAHLCQFRAKTKQETLQLQQK